MKPIPARRTVPAKPYRAPAGAAMTQEEKQQYLKLDFNEATYPPSPLVAEQLGRVDLNFYPDMEAVELRRALADYTGRKSEEIRVWNGSDAALRAICWAYLDNADWALLREPTYAQFGTFVKQAGANLGAVEGDDAFDASPLMYDSGLAYWRPKLFYVVNPNNPTGVLYNLATISYWLSEYPWTLFVVDEAYHEYGLPSAAPLLSWNSNLIIVRSFSKAFALAGVRVGYTLSSPETAKVLDMVRNGKDVSGLAQAAAFAALEDLDYMQARVADTLNAKSWTVDRLRGMGLEVKDSPANFVLIKTLDAARAVREFKEQGVLVRDRSYLFQLDGYIRVTIGSQEQMEQFVAVAQKVLVKNDS